jgi:hypothetical protein
MRLAIGDERHFANELRGVFRSVSFRRDDVIVPVDKGSNCYRIALVAALCVQATASRCATSTQEVKLARALSPRTSSTKEALPTFASELDLVGSAAGSRFEEGNPQFNLSCRV